MNVVVLSHPTLCSVVHEWWAGSDGMWESVGSCSKSTDFNPLDSGSVSDCRTYVAVQRFLELIVDGRVGM